MVFRPRALPVLIAAFLLVGCGDPAPTTGTLVVNITGLPQGANASVRVRGPNDFFQLVRTTGEITNLAPGAYIVIRDTVIVASTRFGVPTVRDTIDIAAGAIVAANAPYAISSGSMNVTITGLPSNVAARLRVVGGGIDQILGMSMLLDGLRPASYEVIADTLTSFFGDKYLGLPLNQTVTVTASTTPVNVSANYVLTSGNLAITVNGVPASVAAQGIRVTGPSGYDSRVGQTTTLRGLASGTYSITASTINGVCPTIYATSSGTQTRDVAPGNTSDVTVDYTESQVVASQLNLKIDKVYLTQASQNASGTVPLISGKPALLRVFGSANQCNAARPRVRVTLSSGAVFDIDPGEDSVRIAPDEGLLASTWNVAVPGIDIEPGLTIVAEMDQTAIVPEANETDNRYPTAGTALVEVRAAPTVALTLVPITQMVGGVALTGDVTPQNVDQFLELSRKVHPVGAYDVQFRAPYTTTRGPIQSPTSWNQLLADLSAVRVAEGSSRYYHGILKVNYSSGIAGIAYIGNPNPEFDRRTGITWDFLPSASRIMAHELGHNFGRRHSPCGGPDGVDQAYPYSGGSIGAFGWDPIDGLKSPTGFTDVMGYCNIQWISDYTYTGMMDWLLNQPTSPAAASSAEQPSLLIWGRIENGQPILEPAFEISARPTTPAPGPHRISALGDDGAELFGVSFAGERIADLPFEAETFAFTVPLSALRGRAMASLRLTARGRTVSSVASTDVAADPSATVTRVGTNAMRVRWDANRFPVVMVRDPERGHILSLARGGDATIVTRRSELDLNFSNRLRSSRRLTRLQ